MSLDIGDRYVPPPVTNSGEPPPVYVPAQKPPSAGDLPPPGDTGTDGVDGLPPPSSDALSGAGSTPLEGLEEQFSADVYAFLALLQQLAQTMKTTARLEATSELQAQVNALLSAAEDMKQSAHKRFASAMTQAIGQIVSGAVQVVAGSLALLATIKSASKENESIMYRKEAEAAYGRPGEGHRAWAQDLDRTSKSLEQLSKKLTAAGQFGNVAGTGLGQSVTGSTGLEAGRLSRDAELTDAERTEKEAVAAEHEKAYQAALEVVSTMQQFISEAQQTLKAMLDKDHEGFKASMTV